MLAQKNFANESDEFFHVVFALKVVQGAKKDRVTGIFTLNRPCHMTKLIELPHLVCLNNLNKVHAVIVIPELNAVANVRATARDAPLPDKVGWPQIALVDFQFDSALAAKQEEDVQIRRS